MKLSTIFDISPASESVSSPFATAAATASIAFTKSEADLIGGRREVDGTVFSSGNNPLQT
jgi:hypothetical protein